MKLQIKTLNQKTLVINIEDSCTVYDLKKELAMYPDVGVRPELQKLIYAGKILTNEEQLSACSIDVKKFLVVMVLKQPLLEAPPPPSPSSSSSPTPSSPAAKSATASKDVSTTPDNTTESPATSTDSSSVLNTPTTSSVTDTSASGSADDSMVATIVNMGYPENQVRSALAASFNNPERAIEYLVEGIPTSPSTPEAGLYTSTIDDEISPFEIFRTDPQFQNLRRAIQQHPDLINDAIQHVCQSNPALLSLINENQHEFLNMLLEASDDDDDDDAE